MNFQIDTILESKAITSVVFQGIYVLANSVAGHAIKFAEPCLFHCDEWEGIQYIKQGTITKVKIGSRYFILTARHNIGLGLSMDNIFLVNNDAKMLFTGESAIFPMGSDLQLEDFDIIAVEFTKHVIDGVLPSIGWYDISTEIDRKFTPKPLLALCVGYPTDFNSINYDAATYAAKAVPIFGHEFDNKIKGRLAFKPINDLQFSPSGMSGSPVFAIVKQESDLAVQFAGVLTNASETMCNFVSLVRIAKLFRYALQRA